MNPDEIVINERGVTILGFLVGLAPTVRDFELAFEGYGTRTSETPNAQRQLRICDSKGISWLADLKLSCVLLLQIRLGLVSHRRTSEVDPDQFFEGKVRIGQYTTQGPFSHETGEVIRKVTIPGLGVRLIPDRKKVRAITVAFLENETAPL